MTRKILSSNLLKFGLAAVLIGYLLYNAWQKPEFAHLLREPKDWGLLTAASALMFTGVCISFVRWQLLVQALDFPFSMLAAFRLGFLGYLFNFVAPGGVGGDLIKAISIAREYHGRRAQAVATVVIDRIVGLYALFLVAAGAVLWHDLTHADSARVRSVAYGTLIGTAVGAIGIIMLLIPGFTSGKLSEALSNLPKIGRIIHQLLEAVRMYRSRLGSIVASLAVSVVLHLCTVLGFFLMGRAIPGASPTLAEHFVIVPLAMVVSAIPITPGGLGTFELCLAELFATMSGQGVSESRGLVIALIYRLITIAVAMIGVAVYVATKRQVGDVVHDAEVAEAEELV